MPTRKGLRKSYKSGKMSRHEVNDGALNLLDLPSKALALVAKQSTRVLGPGHPLLGVSRGARDAVFNGLTKLRLDLERDDTASSVQALARLLDRACRRAPPGLTLGLHAHDLEIVGGEEESVLGALLQPTVTGGSWVNVHTLVVVMNRGARAVKLGPVVGPRLAAAFPNLRTFDVRGVTILGDSFFTGLLNWPHLHTIKWKEVTLLDTAVQGVRHLFTALPSLRALDLHITEPRVPLPLSTFASLTQLTHLALHANYGPLREIASLAQSLQQLQYLSYSGPDGWVADALVLQQLLTSLPQLTGLNLTGAGLNQPALDSLLHHGGTRLTKLWVGRMPELPFRYRHVTHVDPHALQQLLSSCPLLAELGLSCTHVDQAGLDVLLAHTQLTDLTVQSITPTPNWAGAGAPCGWRKLAVTGQQPLFVLPRLPLPFHTFSFNGKLQLPAGDVSLDAQLAMLQRAATYLGRCQQVKCSTPFQLAGPQLEPGGAFSGHFSPAQRVQLLESLAPMAAHITRLDVNGGTVGWSLGRAEVEALSRAVGSRLEHLSLRACHLQPGFCPAVLSAASPLPLLTVLELGYGVQMAHLALACINSQRRLTLKLESGLYESAGAGTLAEQLQLWGYPEHALVTVQRWDGWSIGHA